MNVSRRAVLAGGAAVMAAAGTSLGSSASAQNAPRFSLGFAPHEGAFASRGDRIEQIAYAADQGFTAWEDNEAAGRTVAHAMDDAHAALSVAGGVAQEGGDPLARLVAPQAVQVELALQRPDAAQELAVDFGSDVAPAERQHVVGLEQ